MWLSSRFRAEPSGRASRATAIATMVALVVALVLAPAQTLHVVWDVVIPLLPAVFLLNPLLWRNVCPLATLNALTGDRFGRRRIDATSATRGWSLGLVLLYLLVPARRYLLNTSGVALAATLLCVVIAALAAGLVFARRGGFCDTWCPVLPVEKLYGQAPLLPLTATRCATCTRCVAAGCIDVAGAKAIAQTIGRRRHDLRWLATSFGIFAASFPGFIIGYFTIDNVSVRDALRAYAHIGTRAALCYFIVAGLVAWWKISSQSAVRSLAAISFALYYWFVAPSLGSAFEAPLAGTTLVRVGAATLIAAWVSEARSRA